ncbi:fasciclin domain-containing protein [Pirellulaceae bacterium SH449]
MKRMKSTLALAACLGLITFGTGFSQDLKKTQSSSTKSNKETMDIVETAIGAGKFKTLVTALKAADLVKTLKGKGPFTVFAPNDEAFAKLPEGTLDELLKPENQKKLTGILTYHVVSQELMAADVSKLKKIKTVEGREITVEVKDGKVMLNKSTVVGTDIKCTNGVIHIIDIVLLPKE